MAIIKPFRIKSFKNKKSIIECIKKEGILVEGLMTMGPNTQQTKKIERAS